MNLFSIKHHAHKAQHKDLKNMLVCVIFNGGFQLDVELHDSSSKCKTIPVDLNSILPKLPPQTGCFASKFHKCVCQTKLCF